jgi:RimJ/RimL family protein N-acetyltransferase
MVDLLHNEHGQPIGFPVPNWKPRPQPPRTPMEGRFCRIEALEPERHAAELYDADSADKDGQSWTYMGYGPWSDYAAYRAWADAAAKSSDPLFHAIIDRATAKAVGVASFLRIDAGVGVIEVGHIHYSPALQRTTAATEAMYLLMRRVFDELGYRRYEWKCDALNAPSRRAALRLGFRYEGIFRQATMYKGRNRDTAWYSIIDKEWPALKAAYDAWLAPENFGPDGTPLRRLSQLTSQALTGGAQGR